MRNIYIITPSYLIENEQDHADGIKQLSKLGFHVLNPEFQHSLPAPADKAAQLLNAFEDPGVDIILALRGGYSAMKMLPFMNFELIKANPKILAGFSDVSALLNPIYERTGLVTLHAPMVLNLGTPTDYTVQSFLNAVTGYPEKNLLKGANCKVYRPGTACGILKGGNLITLSAMIGTPWEVDLAGAILFLEDVDEQLHEVDRYLTQWVLAGKLDKVKAIILGDFRGIRSEQVYDVLASQMSLDIPVVHCPYIGHVANKITLPVGAEAELDTVKQQLLIKKMAFPGGHK